MKPPKLDLYEQQVYNDLTNKGIEPQRVLRLLINKVEGDYTQLSKGLLKYAKSNGLILAIVCVITVFLTTIEAKASIDIPKLADAIYKAEGGAKTRHPYGILKKYKTTTPRQACINTIKSNLKRWNGKGDFITFLGRTYCPVGALNDPRGLNRHWVKNVRKFYYGT